ncbi:hypothetical protein DB88DRAFT_486894 [Papiliotrema laurentii]|uniref:RAN protein binding protein n=1 Tax=Papiliotrema laurentii TaxID=5418 RepID=A0AAD9FRG8_PAPLA|nr:hypothetical protein DB88DRAFT_486894 [Papiliotrema laurentii]
MSANGHPAPADAAQTSKVQPSDVGWQFVPQYYNFVNKQPHRLHCFYNKRSTFIHGEEGDDAQPALGQAEIHERINAIGYDQCKVYIHSIDSQSSANGGIIILVIGEMSNKNQPWRKFTQTFFLAEQPNGYFVLNDIFRYLKEEVEEDEEEYVEQEAAVEVPEEAPVVSEETIVPVPPTEAPTPVPEAVEAAQPAEEVPTEAVVASVPDEDVAPSEPATAVEEPVTSAPEIAEVKPEVEAKPEAKPEVKAETKSEAKPEAKPEVKPEAAPAKPKTWASLAASNAGKPWGATAAAPVPAPAPAPTPAPAPKKEEPAQPANLENKHPYYVNASRVNINHCFVKLPNWSPDGSAGAETVDPEAIKKAASRFGEVVSVETVKNKACAFVEFAKVEGARRAIIASLTVAQGGEGGVKLESGGKLNFEVRKDKEERGKKTGRPQGERPRGQNSERGGSTRGRGRGGARGGSASAGEKK